MSSSALSWIPPAALRNDDNFADRTHPPKMARYLSDLRRAAGSCPPSQQPSKVATISQIATPQGMARCRSDVLST
eukprot:2732254-Pyramimonas_sp.AAC.1